MSIYLYNDCCFNAMHNITNGSVDLTVTSPPYDSRRNYEDTLVWGEDVWRQELKELYRITKEGGVVVWVVADATIKGSETGTSFKQALDAINVGFRLHDTMIYAKNNYAPQSYSRYEQAFEYMFVFSKGKPKTFNALRIPCVTAGKKAAKKMTFYNHKGEALVKECANELVKDTKPRNNVWFYNTGNPEKLKHPAIFPLQLAIDHVLTWTNEGDLVFDPMMGSGTTGVAAIKNNRNFIGVEKVEEYYNIAKERIDAI